MKKGTKISRYKLSAMGKKLGKKKPTMILTPKKKPTMILTPKKKPTMYLVPKPSTSRRRARYTA